MLLDNAIKVSPHGGTVRLTAAADRASVAIHVVDQGPGMTAQDKARATDRFWRGSAASKSDGSGLGLAIAAALLAASGGSVTFDDAPPRGLDVVVRLPRWKDGSAPATVPEPS